MIIEHPGRTLIFSLAIIVLFISYLPTAVADTITLIGNNTKWACLQTESRTFLVRYFNSDRYFNIRFGPRIRSIRSKQRIVRRRLRRAHQQNTNAGKIERLGVRAASLETTLTDLYACRSGDPTPSYPGGGLHYPDACDVIGGSQSDAVFSARIINGDACTIGDSATVLLQMENLGNCTGTVVRSEPGFSAVITAGHCLPPDVNSVRVQTESGTFTASSFFAHPGFSADNDPLETNDVGIVLFSEQLPTRVAPVNSNDDLSVGEIAYIGGFGLDEDRKIGKLRAAPVTVYSSTEHSIIIKYSGKGEWGNTCRGDSGGPLVIARDNAWALAGITSNGELYNCGSGDVSRFSNIAQIDNKSFINTHVPGLM